MLFYQGDHDLLAASRGRERMAGHLRCVLPPAELVEGKELPKGGGRFGP